MPYNMYVLLQLKNEAGNEFHLSVDLAEAPTWNMARSVFVGNMPFSMNLIPVNLPCISEIETQSS